MSARAESSVTGMVKYDAMCQAIVACHTVDEAKDIRDRARAVEVYAKQARNRDAEHKAAEIRIRAERRTGELLIEMKESGKRRDRGGDQKSTSRAATLKTALPDLGITRDQSSKWQDLARIPAEEFEEAIARPGALHSDAASGKGMSRTVSPSTEGILNSRRAESLPKVQMDPDALWVWGRIKEFGRAGILEHSVAATLPGNA
jgi:hypothetical protein